MQAEAGMARGGSETARRAVTIVIGLPLFLLVLREGGPLWTLLLGALALGAAREWIRLARTAGYAPAPEVVLPGTVVLFAAISREGSLVAGAVGALVMAALLAQLGSARRPQALANAGATVLGVLYSAFFVWLDLLRNLPNGYAYTLLLVATVWAADSAAMLGGRAFGRRLLAPAISPKKTWEGAFSGVFGALLGALVVGVPLRLPVGVALGVAAASAVAGFVGDLSESTLKRSSGVKDTGALLPGHGGILDRFDAMLFAAPVVYGLLRWWMA